MRHDVLMSMSLADLDRYGSACGIDVTGEQTRERKVEVIEERRGRVAEVNVLGMTLTIPKRRLHDQRLADILSTKLTDESASTAMVLLLGEEQYEAIIERCTDEDGVVDVEAIGVAFNTLFYGSDELKNY